MPVSKKVFDEQKLKQYAGQLRSDEFIKYIQSRITYQWEDISKQYYDYIEEAIFGMRLLSKFTLNGRLLEIGSGPGMLTAWLYMNGVDVVGIEPSELGFEFNIQLQKAIWDYFKLPEIIIVDIVAEKLDPVVHGKFDLIFSVNVMEHLLPANIELAFSKMKDVLNEDGMMHHHCPNYIIPFEPHYGLPLIPFFPQAMGKWKGVADENLWRSINFITLPRMRKVAKHISMDVSFQQKAMKDSFIRLEHDKEFAERHPGLVKVYPLLKKLGVISMFGLIPPVLCTPMTYTLMRKNIQGYYNDKGLKISAMQKR